MTFSYVKQQKRMLKAVLIVILGAVIYLVSDLFKLTGIAWCETALLLLSQLWFGFVCYTRFDDLKLMEESIHLVNKYYISKLIGNSCSE